MKSVSCYLCGSESARIVDVQDFDDEYLGYVDPAYLAAPRHWKMCVGCGLVYHDPRLDEADVVALYEERYRRHSLKTEETADQFFDRIMAIPKAQSENYAKVAWLKPHLAAHLAPGGADRALLDIGCSAGMFLKHFIDDVPGWRGAGVEPTVRFAETASRRIGGPVRSGVYRGGQFDRRFDLVTVIHVLEHVLDPLAFLAEVKRDLAPGGLLFIEVPDIADFGSLPPQHDRFMSPHIYYFSATTAAQLLARAGFGVVVREFERSPRGHANLRLICRAGDETAAAAPAAGISAGSFATDAVALRQSWRQAQAA